MIHKLTGTRTILRISGVLAVVAIMATLSGCGLFQKMLTSMNIHPELAERGEKFPGSYKCGHCHIDIYKEWEG